MSDALAATSGRSPGGRRRDPLLRCFALYREQPWLSAAATAVLVAVNLMVPWTQHLIGAAIDDVQRGRAAVLLADGAVDLGRAWHWAAILIAVTLARSVVLYLGTVLAQVQGQTLLHSLRDRLFARVQTLDLAFHLRHGAGELITRTTRDSDKVRDAVTGGWRTLVEVTVVVLGTLGFLAWYDPLLAVVPTVLVALALAVVMRRAGHLVALDRHADEAYDAVAQDLSEGVHGVRVIKAFALEGARIRRFDGHIGLFAERTRAAARYAAIHLSGPQLLVACGHGWLLWHGAWLVAHGRLSPGGLIGALMMMQAVVFRIEALGRVFQTFADARASAGRIVELLDAEVAPRGGSRPLPAGALGLRLRGVTVRDAGGRAVLDGLDLDLAPGGITALVGATGCGKSTLASLLPRLRDPDGGSVEVGNAHGWVAVQDADRDALRRQVQVVPQDGFLFSDSLAGNLRLAAPGADDEELRAALVRAAAEDVLAGLPQGLASRVGERGVTLSGGQRQRVCLARAFLARPALLCIDDGTSALDAVTERRILTGLTAGGATVLLIASKLSTLRCAARVLLMQDGRIAAAGSHDELAATCPAYRDLLGLDDEAPAAGSGNAP
jgi:ABC-type multidrug transport system fused ATPase/permease subunit